VAGPILMPATDLKCNSYFLLNVFIFSYAFRLGFISSLPKLFGIKGFVVVVVVVMISFSVLW
jgi:hypothetical protein